MPTTMAEPAAAPHAVPRGSGPDHGADHHPPPFQRLLGLLRADRADVRLLALFAAAVSFLFLTTPLVVQVVVQTVQFGTVLQPVVALAVVLFSFLTLAAGFQALQTYVCELLQRRLFVRVAADLADRLPRVRVEAFDREHGPELVNRFFDVLTVQKVTATLLVEGLALLFQTLVGLVLLACYHPWLLAFDLALVAALAVILVVLGRGGVRTSVQESVAKYAVAGWLEEMARHPLAFKLDGGPAYALARADRLSQAYLAARAGHFAVTFRQTVSGLVLQVLASTALLGIGGMLVLDGEMTLGQLVAAELVVTLLLSTFAKFGKYLEGWYDLLAAVDKLGHLMDLPLEPATGAAPPALPGPAALTVQDLRVTYAAGPPALDHCRLTLRPGERVALVGSNGVGKSTLIDVVLGLRQPTAGRVELGGLDYRDLGPAGVRALVSGVKELEIFGGTVLENVALGRPGVTDADVREALEAVGLLDEVRRWPEGLNTPLCTGGAPLSQGQARRLVLARAIVTRPRLLALDETLDDLPADHQARVLATLFDPAAPWTLLVASHDPAVQSRADRQIVLTPPQPLPGGEA